MKNEHKKNFRQFVTRYLSCKLIALVICFGLSWALCRRPLLTLGDSTPLTTDVVIIGVELFLLICAIELVWRGDEIFWQLEAGFSSGSGDDRSKKANEKRPERPISRVEIRVVDLGTSPSQQDNSSYPDPHADHYQLTDSAQPKDTSIRRCAARPRKTRKRKNYWRFTTRIAHLKKIVQ